MKNIKYKTHKAIYYIKFCNIIIKIKNKEKSKMNNFI